MTLQCIAIQSKITNLQQACHLLFRIFVESWTIKLLKNGFVSKALQFQAIKSKCSQLISVINNLINQKIHLKEHLAWIFIFYSFYCKHADKMCGGKRSAIELALHSPAALVKTKGISIFPCSFGHHCFLQCSLLEPLVMEIIMPNETGSVIRFLQLKAQPQSLLSHLLMQQQPRVMVFQATTC